MSPNCAPSLPPIAVSPARAAELLGISRASVYNLVSRGELRIVKLGRSARIPVSELDRLLGEGGDAA